MRRLLKSAVVTGLAVAVAIAVNACAPTQPVPVSQISEPAVAESQSAVEPHSAAEPDMQMVRLGGD